MEGRSFENCFKTMPALGKVFLKQGKKWSFVANDRLFFSKTSKYFDLITRILSSQGPKMNAETIDELDFDHMPGTISKVVKFQVENLLNSRVLYLYL